MLNNVLKYIDQVDGELWLENSLDQSSEFSVYTIVTFQIWMDTDFFLVHKYILINIM